MAKIIKMKDLIKEIGQPANFDLGANYKNYPKTKSSGGNPEQYQGYSSKEAKNIVDGALKNYAKELRKVQHKVIKEWMSKAKSGHIDFFDLMRGFNTGDIARAHPYEVRFLHAVLTKDKIIDRFRKYFGGKKGKKR